MNANVLAVMLHSALKNVLSMELSMVLISIDEKPWPSSLDLYSTALKAECAHTYYSEAEQPDHEKMSLYIILGPGSANP